MTYSLILYISSVSVINYCHVDNGGCLVITIKDIARLAGVSITTVSKVINNYPDIGQETREKLSKS